MSINISLKEMTLHEKIAAMELLWDDRARSPEAIASPAWHKDILDERRQQITEGSAQFADWEADKAEIRNKVS
ncbi:MAG: addiction module protein [Nitrospirota bacterium]